MSEADIRAILIPLCGILGLLLALFLEVHWIRMAAERIASSVEIEPEDEQ